ncbi:hypothetical protein [Paracoccus sp. N5]|uniref:hypothetical protein n=1 Tax=Paracoccus sp. N5 TaxID=1101189 RepID=UPI00037CB4C6|nr:hypothetical protein [Paracoccus sp. N5]
MKFTFPIKAAPQQSSTASVPLTMQDVQVWIQTTRPYAYATIMDYRAQLARIPAVMSVNSLRDVPADIQLFDHRSKHCNYRSEHFVTYDAWLRWTRKIAGMLRKFSGEADERRERRDRQDEWASLLNHAGVHVGSGTARSPTALIPLRLLAEEARKAGVAPCDLTNTWLSTLGDQLSPHRRKSLHKAIKNLRIFSEVSPEIAEMLPPIALSDPARRRTREMELPASIAALAEQLVEESGGGMFDRIEGVWNDRLAPTTLDVRRAALRKYLATGVALGVIDPHCVSLAPAFSMEVFDQIMRTWTRETNDTVRITARSMRQYVGVLMILANRLGLPVDFMAESKKTNARLKAGKEEQNSMPRSTQEFCASLLRNRKKEMTFRSMHVRFREMAEALIAGEKDTSAYKDEHIIQFGVLAAYSAIALWAIPLRITTMLGLRHLGPRPNLLLPCRANQKARLQIPKDEVKNKVDLHGNIAAGPTKGLEILEWYVDRIRPMIPWAARSDHLFPGYEGEQMSDKAVRIWIQTHTRDLGIPMVPHNFRHGLASLWLKARPGDYSGAARLLGNTEATVRLHYAWIDHDAELLNIQAEIARQAGFHNAR